MATSAESADFGAGRVDIIDKAIMQIWGTLTCGMDLQAMPLANCKLSNLRPSRFFALKSRSLKGVDLPAERLKVCPLFPRYFVVLNSKRLGRQTRTEPECPAF